MTEFVRKSAVKDAADMNVGSDVYEELDHQVEYYLNQAQERAKANGRKTVQARDV